MGCRIQTNDALVDWICMSNEVDKHFSDEKSVSFKVVVPEHGSRFLSDGALTDDRGGGLN